MDRARCTEQPGGLGTLLDDLGQRSLLDQNVVHARGLRVVRDAERRGCIALGVQVDDQHPGTHVRECRCEVDGRRCLTYAALLIRHREDPSSTRVLQRDRVKGPTTGGEVCELACQGGVVERVRRGILVVFHVKRSDRVKGFSTLRAASDPARGRSDGSPFHVKHAAALMTASSGSATDGGVNDTGCLVENALSESEYPDVGESESTDLLLGGFDLRLGTSPLEEHEPSSGTNQRSRHGNQRAKRTHSTRSDDIDGCLGRPFLRTSTNHGDVAETQSVGLLRQPGDAPLHRLDQRPRDVGSGDSQDDSREARPRADVSSAPIEEGGSDRTIQNVPRPQSRKLQGTDESSGLALLGQSRRELTGKVDPLTEQGSRCGGFGLKSGHRCFT